MTKQELKELLVANPELQNMLRSGKLEDFITELDKEGKGTEAFNLLFTAVLGPEKALSYISTIKKGYVDGARGELVIPNNVKTLEMDCFQGCDELTSVKIPASITDIPRRCFKGCTSLHTVYIEGQVTFGVSCFANTADDIVISIPEPQGKVRIATQDLDFMQEHIEVRD